MNSRERVRRTLHHENPDRVPLNGDFCPQIWAKLKEHFRTESNEQVKEKLGIDIKGETLGPPFSFQKQNCAWFEEDWGIYVGNNVFESEWGFRCRVKPGLSAPQYIYHPLSDTTNLYKYTFPDISAPGRFEKLEKTLSNYKDNYMVVASIPWNFFKHCWQLRGFQTFLEDLYLNPQFVEELLGRLLAFKLEQVREYAELGADIIGIGGDIGMQDRMIIAPDIWRKYFKPKLRVLIRESRKQNKDVLWSFHSDGYIESIIPDLIEIGFNIINPIQPECMNPVKIKKMYGDRITLHGTISLQKTLPFGTLEDVREEVLSRIKECGNNGGLILAPANTVTADVPIENVLAVYSTAEETIMA